MLKIRDFEFENVEGIYFVMPPKCDCEECNEDLSLVIKEEQKVEEAAAQILYNLDCSHVGALVIQNKNKSKLLFPDYLEDCEYESFNIQCLHADNISEKESIELFSECVNDLDLHTILILKEDKNEDNVYNFIYE